MMVDQLPEPELVFFPTYSRWNPRLGVWQSKVHAWAFHRPIRPIGETRIQKKLLDYATDYLELPKADQNTEEWERFREVSAFFLLRSVRSSSLQIQFKGGEMELVGAAANGHVKGWVSTHEPLKSERWEGFKVQFASGGLKKTMDGRVLVLAENGLSVVTDIDDTIRLSGVSNKRELLKNTFTRGYQPVSGMPELYQKLSSQGAQFHYVSASPWQLFQPLEEFRARWGFPEGTYHLKTFRWKDRSFANLFRSPLKIKRKAIEKIMRDFPKRKFILIGDSGEKDPEIYGEVSRLFPKQVQKVYLRNVNRERPSSRRMQAAFREVDPSLWALFDDPNEVLTA